jgi:hypothetical protein
VAKPNKSRHAEPSVLEEIKKLTVMAMFSDDHLMEQLVLKGGNALDLVHRISTRASVDVDFSIEADFVEQEDAFRRIKHALEVTFPPAGYQAFDVEIAEKPEAVTPDMAEFWGGYAINFKLIESKLYDELSHDLDQLRKRALQLGQGTRFRIEISKFEYTAGKEPRQLDGINIFVYSPAMMVCEKLRALCQQTPEYAEIVKRGHDGAPRARDFVDIEALVRTLQVDIASEENRSLLSTIFEAKRVPLGLLGRISNFRDFHRTDFPAVQATVKAGVKLKEFDFYFDFVLDLVDQLERLRNM